MHENDLKCAQVFWFTSVESEMRENDFSVEGIFSDNMRETGSQAIVKVQGCVLR